MKNNKKIITIFVIIITLLTVNIYAYKTDYELIAGNLKVKVFHKTGNFCLYALSDTGKYTPLFDDKARASYNKFFVYYNGKPYELRKLNKKYFNIERDENSIKITHTYTDKFEVTQRFSFTKEKYNTSGALLKIETTVKNLNQEIVEIGLKTLIDTKLGENKQGSISTDSGRVFISETTVVPKYEKSSAIISKEENLSCLFLINHSQATPIDQIFVANWNRLMHSNWTPKIIRGRSFNTRYAHNDAALLFLWPIEKKLKRYNSR